LNQHYPKLAEEENLHIKVFPRYSVGLCKKIAETDGVILFTNLISHKAARHVYKLARENKINLICSHNCSVSSVRDCIAELKKSNRAACRCRAEQGCGCGGGSTHGCAGGCGCQERSSHSPGGAGRQINPTCNQPDVGLSEGSGSADIRAAVHNISRDKLEP